MNIKIKAVGSNDYTELKLTDVLAAIAKRHWFNNRNYVRVNRVNYQISTLTYADEDIASTALSTAVQADLMPDRPEVAGTYALQVVIDEELAETITWEITT